MKIKHIIIILLGLLVFSGCKTKEAKTEESKAEQNKLSESELETALSDLLLPFIYSDNYVSATFNNYTENTTEEELKASKEVTNYMFSEETYGKLEKKGKTARDKLKKLEESENLFKVYDSVTKKEKENIALLKNVSKDSIVKDKKEYDDTQEEYLNNFSKIGSEIVMFLQGQGYSLKESGEIAEQVLNNITAMYEE